MPICTICKVEKDEMKFSKCGGGKRRTQCSPCITVRRRDYQKTYHNNYIKQYYAKNNKTIKFRARINRLRKLLKFKTTNPYYEYMTNETTKQEHLKHKKFMKRVKTFERKFIHCRKMKNKNK